MLEINLLPVREARRKAGIRQQLQLVVLVVIVAGAAIGFTHSRLRDQIAGSELRVAQMQKDIERFEPQIQQVEKFKKEKSKLQKKIDIIEGLDRARSGPVRMLDELASRTPERLWLTKLQTKGSSVKLEGESLDNELVALFLSELGASKYFSSVDLNETEIENARGGLKIVSFSINAQLATGKAKKQGKNKKKKKAKGKA